MINNKIVINVNNKPSTSSSENDEDKENPILENPRLATPADFLADPLTNMEINVLSGNDVNLIEGEYDDIKNNNPPGARPNTPVHEHDLFPDDSIEFLFSVPQAEIDIKEEKEDRQRRLLNRDTPRPDTPYPTRHRRTTSGISQNTTLPDQDSSVEYLGGASEDNSKSSLDVSQQNQAIPINPINIQVTDSLDTEMTNENDSPRWRQIQDQLDNDFNILLEEDLEQEATPEDDIPCAQPYKTFIPPTSDESSSNDSVFPQDHFVDDPMVAMNIKLLEEIRVAKTLIADQKETLDLNEQQLDDQKKTIIP